MQISIWCRSTSCIQSEVIFPRSWATFSLVSVTSEYKSDDVNTWRSPEFPTRQCCSNRCCLIFKSKLLFSWGMLHLVLKFIRIDDDPHLQEPYIHLLGGIINLFQLWSLITLSISLCINMTHLFREDAHVSCDSLHSIAYAKMIHLFHELNAWAICTKGLQCQRL